MKTASGWTLIVTCMLLGAPARAAEAPAPPETARVCEPTLSKLLDGGQDVRLVVYHRGKGFRHGYAVVEGADNRPHRVDPTPAAPFGYFLADGKELGKDEYEVLTGVYAYKRPEWRKYYDLWRGGKLIPRRIEDVPALRWDGKALSGTADVFICAHVKPGAQATFQGRVFRAAIRATGDERGRLSGTYEAYPYSMDDRLYRPMDPAKTVRGSCAGGWRDDFWQVRPGTEYAAGRDWPNARGPNLNGSAIDSGAELVDDLHAARLLWVSEEVLPGGRGARRNPLDPRPANDFPAGSDAYGGPVVSGGKVYLYAAAWDARHLAPASDLMQVRGAPPTFGPRGYSDVVLCIDARTGRTIWRREFAWGLAGSGQGPPTGKGGRGLTPCVHDGRVFARGCRALYCLDAATGESRWTNARLGGAGGGWSRDVSPVVIGGVLLLKAGADADLLGLDPDTGKQLWRQDKVAGTNAVPSRVVLEGRPYIVSAYGDYGADMSAGRLVMIEPKTGRICWETDQVCKNENSLCVVGDRLCADVPPIRKSADGKKVLCRLGGFRLAPAAATKAWTAQTEAFFSGRFITPLAHRGHVYVDSHDTGHFTCIDAGSGKVVKEFAQDIDQMAGHTGGGNWCVATDDRIITSGLLLFAAAPAFEMLGKPWRLQFSIGYCCPIQPALADGRLFVRLDDSLVCYDLRKAR